MGVKDARRRLVLIEEFVEQHLPMFRNQASGLCRTCGVPKDRYLDEAESLVHLAASTLLRKAEEDISSLDGIQNWEAILWRQARVLFRSFVDNNDSSLSGTVAKRRRYREAQRTRTILRDKLEREPTDAEVVEETNARMTSLRKDAANQGILISLDDLRLPSSNESVEILADVPDDFMDDGFVLHPVEGKALVAEIISHCRQRGELIGRFASLWLAEAYTSGRSDIGGDTVAYICRTLEITRARFAELDSEVKRLAQELLRDKGIEGIAG